MSDRNLLLLAEVDFLTQFLEDSSVWTTTTSPVSSPRGQTSPRANNNNNNSNYNNNSGGAFNASATSINDSNSSNSDGTPPGSRTNTDAVAVQAPTNAFATTTTTTTTAAVKSAVQDNQNNAATSSSGTAAVADSSTPQQRRRPVSPDRRKSLKGVFFKISCFCLLFWRFFNHQKQNQMSTHINRLCCIKPVSMAYMKMSNICCDSTKSTSTPKTKPAGLVCCRRRATDTGEFANSCSRITSIHRSHHSTTQGSSNFYYIFSLN